MARVRQRSKPTTAPVVESDAVAADILKIHGPNIIRRGSVAGRWKHIPTGIFAMDMAQFGGLPRSQMSMYYGWESAGKTLVGMRAMAQAQKRFPDMKVVMVDTEGTYDPVWGAIHGIDNDALMYVQPDYGEQAGDIAIALLKASDISMIMMDSLPAMMPHKVGEKSLEDDIVALQARLIGRFVQVANQALIDERKRDHTPALLIINQWRSKIAFMGDTRNLPGGNALKFFIFNRVELLNKEELGSNDEGTSTVLYNTHTAKVTKNKEGTGIRQCEFKMIRDPAHPLGPGFIDDSKVVLSYAKKFGLWTGAGATQKFDGLDQTFRTMEEGANYLYNDLDFYEDLKVKLIGIQRERCGLDPTDWL